MKQESAEKKEESVRIKDLPAPYVVGVRDSYLRFELTLPFKRMKIDDFVRLIAKANQ